MLAEVAAPWPVSSAVWSQKSHLEAGTATLPQLLNAQVYEYSLPPNLDWRGWQADGITQCPAFLTKEQSGENQSCFHPYMAWKLQGLLLGLCVLWWKEAPSTLMTKTKQGHLTAYPSRLLTMASDLKCNLWGLRLNLKEREEVRPWLDQVSSYHLAKEGLTMKLNLELEK